MYLQPTNVIYTACLCIYLYEGFLSCGILYIYESLFSQQIFFISEILIPYAPGYISYSGHVLGESGGKDNERK